MSNLLGHLLVGLLVTAVVGVVSGGGWAYFLVGAVLALALWVMLFAGSFATPDRRDRGHTSSRQFGMAAAVALVLGYAMYVIGDGATWWSVGFIMAGAVIPPVAAGLRGDRADERV